MITQFNFLGALAFALCSMIFTPTSFAAENDQWCTVGGDSGRVLKAVALTGSVEARTFSFGKKACGRGVSSYQYLIIEADYTWAHDGDLTITCTTGQERKTATYTPQICTGSGTCTMVDGGVFLKAVLTGTKNSFSFRVGVRGHRAWSCVTAHTAAGAGDVITQYAYLTD